MYIYFLILATIVLSVEATQKYSIKSDGPFFYKDIVHIRSEFEILVVNASKSEFLTFFEDITRGTRYPQIDKLGGSNYHLIWKKYEPHYSIDMNLKILDRFSSFYQNFQEFKFSVPNSQVLKRNNNHKPVMDTVMDFIREQIVFNYSPSIGEYLIGQIVNFVELWLVSLGETFSLIMIKLIKS